MYEATDWNWSQVDSISLSNHTENRATVKSFLFPTYCEKQIDGMFAIKAIRPTD